MQWLDGFWFLKVRFPPCTIYTWHDLLLEFSEGTWRRNIAKWPASSLVTAARARWGWNWGGGWVEATANESGRKEGGAVRGMKSWQLALQQALSALELPHRVPLPRRCVLASVPRMQSPRCSLGRVSAPHGSLVKITPFLPTPPLPSRCTNPLPDPTFGP